jgi:RNA polymerase sigma-70 factor (ECF subfamily)
MTSAENNRMLMKELQEGNQKVFDKLFDQYYHPMCTFIYPLIGDKHIVEDIVSDCFVKLWEQRKDLRIHTSVTNYLLTLVKNAAISFLRKKKLPQIEFEQVSNTITDDDAEIIKESEIYNKLYQALDKLPEQRRTILKLAAFEGKSYQKISQELNISTNTVKTQIARSYRFLKTELAIPYKSILFLLSF